MLKKIALVGVLALAGFVGGAQDAAAWCRTSSQVCYYPCYPCQYYRCYVSWWNPRTCQWVTDWRVYSPWEAQWRVCELRRLGYYATYCCYC